MIVKDMMSTNVQSLSPDMTINDGLKKLFELKISGLPVIDKEGKLVGLFTEKEILKEILPSYVEKVGRFIYETDATRRIEKKVQSFNELKVADVMRRDVMTTNINATLIEVMRILVTAEARRLPVVDENNKVIGIVSRHDIMRTLIEKV
jgi:CBS domain-containing protein